DRMSEKHRYMIAQIARSRGRHTDPADAFLIDLSNRLKRLRHILYSADHTSFVLVTIPEAMAVEETRRFFGLLQKNGINVSHVITNRVETLHADCRYCAARVNAQKPYLKDILRELKDVKHREVPVMPDEVRGIPSLQAFAELLWVKPMGAEK